MFRIRTVYDDVGPQDRDAIGRAQQILREQFPGLREEDIAKIPDELRNPQDYGFRSILFVAEGARGQMRGVAMLLHFPAQGFCYLEYLSAAPAITGRGIGSALYERVREEARALNAVGLFFEALPDDPALSPDPVLRRQNRARLRFYERYGARPIVGTAYETPLRPGAPNPPYLVLDGLGRFEPLGRTRARAIVRVILETKYRDVCSPDYIRKVVESFRDDPIRLRELRYTDREPLAPELAVRRAGRIALVVNDKHLIHHVRERGYVEAPVRIDAILKELTRTGLFERVPARLFSEDLVRAVHDAGFVRYLKRACARVPPEKSIYPYVFPVRNATRPPKDVPLRAGYYCIDTFTPLNHNAFLAARGAVNCALTGAQRLLQGYPLAYALVRPPGHHAERRSFGGFCYFNSTAIAAHYLSRFGRVAVLDVDYHHGNGTQDIFYERADVLTLSIHGHPRLTYPYFSGYGDEKGAGPGKGYNLNIPLPENIGGEVYRKALGHALKRVRRFAPRYLVVAFGLDTAKGDPTGSWSLQAKDFLMNGRMIGELHLPTLVVQEGGYRTQTLGLNARSFFAGLSETGPAPAAIPPPRQARSLAAKTTPAIEQDSRNRPTPTA